MASETIDRLEVEVTATAKGTAAIFSQLESQLGVLKKAFDAIDTSKLSKIQKAVNATNPKINTSGMSKAERDIDASIKKIQQNMAGLKSYADKAMSGDKSAFSTYDKQATSLQSTIDKLSEKFRQLGNIEIPTKYYEKLEAKIESTSEKMALMQKRFQEAKDGKIDMSDNEFKNLGDSIIEAQVQIDKLSAKKKELENSGRANYDPFEKYRESLYKVQETLSDTTSRVQTSMAEMANAQPESSGIDKFIAKLENEIPASLSKIQQDFAGLGSYANAALGGDKSAFTSFERRVTSIQSAIDVLTTKFSQLEGAGVSSEGLEQYRATLQSVQAQLSETANAVRTTYAEMSQAPTTEISKDVERANASFKGMGSNKSILDGISSSLSKIKDNLKGISVHAPNMGKMFKTILKYGFGIRSIYVLFRRLRKAVVESFGELQNSGAFFETTRANVEALKSSLSTLKFQFGAAFEPIFNAVAPALETLVNHLITVMNVISAFMAKLTGKSTYSKVSATFGKVESGAGGAGKAVKELNKQLQGFDELNNLTGNNPGGGGGGGGGGADEGGATYVEESVDSVLGDFGKTLADKIREGDWYGVGEVISNKLSDVMESIPWDDIFNKARDFGTKLANFLNGLINPRLFENIGTTIGNSINTGLIFFDSWGKGMDWVNVGVSLAAGFDAFVHSGWIGQLGETLHTWIAGGLTAATTFFETADFEELGKQIAEFIGNLDIPDLASKLYNLAKSILSALSDAIRGFWDNADITGKFIMAIAFLLGGLIFTNKLNKSANNILSALGLGMEGKKISLNKLIIGVATFEIVGGVVGTLFGNAAEELGFTELAEEYREFASHPITYTIEGLLDIASFIKEEGFQKFADVLKEVFDPHGEFILSLYKAMGIDPIAQTVAELAKSLAGTNTGVVTGANVTKDILGLDNKLSEARKTFANIQGKWGSENLERARTLISNLIGLWGHGTPIGDIDMSDSGTSILDAFKAILPKSMALTKSFQTLGNVAKGTTKRIDGATKSTNAYGSATTSTTKDINDSFASIPDTMKNVVQAATTGIETSLKVMPRTVQTYSDNAWKNIKDSFKESLGWSRTTSAQISSGFNDLPTNVEATFKSAYDKGTSQFANTEKWAFGRAVAVVSNLKDMPEGVRQKFHDAYDKGTSQFKDTKTWIDGVVTTIKKSASYVPTDFTNIFALASSNATKQLTVFTDWFNGLKFNKTATLKTEMPKTSDVQNKWNEIAKVWKDVEASLTFTASGSNSFNVNDAISSLNDVIHEFNYQASLAVGKMVASGAKMKFVPIPDLQYKAARGGIIDMATPVLVGEAGTEAIVPLENHTEWLGKMADMMVGEMVKPQYSSVLTPSYSIGSGNTTSDLAEQNELLREEVQLLRQIANKEVTISSREVFKATRDEANNYYNRTGASPFLN